MSFQSENVRPVPLLGPSLPRRLGVRRSIYHNLPKRALDLSLVVIGAMPVLLLVAVLALLVAGQGGRPFYRQLRVGQGGRQFWMWKLRTMRPDAEATLAALLAADPEARAEWARAQKLRADPRITRLGRMLRKTSLDELPQLWNVAKGDMSLVGPRPMMPEQQGLYPGRGLFPAAPRHHRPLAGLRAQPHQLCRARRVRHALRRNLKLSHRSWHFHPDGAGGAEGHRLLTDGRGTDNSRPPPPAATREPPGPPALGDRPTCSARSFSRSCSARAWPPAKAPTSGPSATTSRRCSCSPTARSSVPWSS